MWRRIVMSTAVLAALAVGAAPVQAQDQTFGINLGYYALRGADGRGSGDVLNANRCIDTSTTCFPLLFEVNDFNNVTIGADWLIGLGDFFEAGAGIGFYQRTVPSIYEFLTAPDQSELEQDLKLRIVPIEASVRFVPTGRRAGLQPYVGVGIALLAWRYSETGSFVDTRDGEIFRAAYVDNGTEAAPLVLAGLRAPVGDQFLIGGQIKWQRADGNLSDDFLGERIDLGALTYQAVFQFRF